MMSTAEATWKYGSVASAPQWLPSHSPPSATAQTTRVWENVAASPSRIAWVTVPRTAMMKAAIIVLLWPGSRPCRAPSRTAEGR